MRRLTMMLALTATAVAAVPAAADAQWDILRRTDTRGGVYDDVYDRGSSRIPPGHLPPRGYCRIWVDGRSPGQQPSVTDCRTAERNRHRYGSNARVIYGDRVYDRNDRNDRYDDRTTRVHDRVINGRRCRVFETWDDGRRINSRTVCDSNSRVYDRNDRRVNDRNDRNDGRWDFRDDDSDGRGKKVKHVKKVKVKHRD
jgi:hypothetical protein